LPAISANNQDDNDDRDAWLWLEHHQPAKDPPQAESGCKVNLHRGPEQRVVDRQRFDRAHRRGPTRKQPPASLKQAYESCQARLAKQRHNLSDRITDNATMLAALVFYCKRLTPGKLTSPAATHAFIKGKSRRVWRRYCKAARYLLACVYGKNLRLPANYLERLRALSLDLWPGLPAYQQFVGLNADLEVNDELRAFADQFPHSNRSSGFPSGLAAERLFFPLRSNRSRLYQSRFANQCILHEVFKKCKNARSVTTITGTDLWCGFF
jgi:hypothetical protein